MVPCISVLALRLKPFNCSHLHAIECHRLLSPAAPPELLAPYLLLQSDDPVNKGLGPRRTSGNEYVNRQKCIASLNRAVGVEYAAAVGTASHGNHIARLRHLIIDAPDDLGHLLRHGTCHEHEVRLSRRAPGDDSHSVKIIVTGIHGHHLDGASGQSERHGPERRRPSPVDQLIHRGDDDVRCKDLCSFFNLNELLGRRAERGNQSHIKASFLHA